MSLHRTAARRDASEPEVVDAFLDGGATVIKHSGKDECDLVVGYRGRNHCVEVKTGNRQPSEDQAKWAREWRGGPVLVIRNAAQAKKAMRVWDEERAREVAVAVEARRHVPSLEEDIAAGPEALEREARERSGT